MEVIKIWFWLECTKMHQFPWVEGVLLSRLYVRVIVMNSITGKVILKLLLPDGFTGLKSYFSWDGRLCLATVYGPRIFQKGIGDFSWPIIKSFLFSYSFPFHSIIVFFHILFVCSYQFVLELSILRYIMNFIKQLPSISQLGLYGVREYIFLCSSCRVVQHVLAIPFENKSSWVHISQDRADP